MAWATYQVTEHRDRIYLKLFRGILARNLGVDNGDTTLRKAFHEG